MPKNKPLAKVLHFDSYWKRQEKYDRLNNSSFSNVDWKELDLKEPYYFFVPKDFAAEENYMKGFSVSEIFKTNNSWVKTDRDSLFIDFERKNLEERFKKLLSGDFDQEFIDKYRVVDSWSFKITERIVWKTFNDSKISSIQYRPFDKKFIYYDEKLVSRPWFKVWEHMIHQGWNLSLTTSRQFWWWQHFICLIANNLVEISSQPFAPYYQFPLYLYNENSQDTLEENGEPERVANFDMEIIVKIEKKLGMKLDTDFTPEDLLDYIYAVLHSKSYRETYKEFLKIDFPRVPFDVSKTVFRDMVKLGRELRSWHLLENEKLTPQNFITKYPEDGDNLVEKIKYSAEKVFINDTQYFDGVPENVWEFYIGWYQPAQKWLKDRKWRNLQYEDIVHYGKIVLTLGKTIKIMEEIEKNFRIWIFEGVTL